MGRLVEDEKPKAVRSVKPIKQEKPSNQVKSKNVPQKAKNVNMVTKSTVKWSDWGIVLDEEYDGLGLKVLSLQDGGLAQRMDIKERDIIFNINQHPVVKMEDFNKVMSTLRYGDAVKIKIKRDVSVIDINSEL